MSKDPDIVEVSPSAVAINEYPSAAAPTDKSVNVATPPEAVIVVVPSNSDAPGLSRRSKVTSVVLSLVTRLLLASLISIIGCRLKYLLCLSVEGYCVKTRCVASPCANVSA